MRYELTVGDIVLESNNDNVIRKVDFLISQENLETNDKSDSLFNTLVVEGEIKDSTQQKTKELLDWSMKTGKADVYKTVKLIVKKDEDVLRDYRLENMYCVSYQEFFHGDDSGRSDTYGKFILKMRQRKGLIGTINVTC